MCDFSETCKDKCLNCYQSCDEDDDCICNFSYLCDKYSCENVLECLEYENLNENCNDIPEKCLTTCAKFMGCSVLGNCFETQECLKATDDFYNFYDDKCTTRIEECYECDEYHMCYECNTICESTCTFASDDECDDGGYDSSFDKCKEGTDCEDCGSRLTNNCSARVFYSPEPNPPPYFPGIINIPSPPPPLPYQPKPFVSKSPSSSPLIPKFISPPPLNHFPPLSPPVPLFQNPVPPSAWLPMEPINNISRYSIVRGLDFPNSWVGFVLIIVCFIFEGIYLFKKRKTNSIPSEVTIPMETL